MSGWRDDEPEVLVPQAGDRDHLSADRAGEPPVVARLIVEIRSDGSRTIARGAIEDASTGQKVAVEARGSTPLSLALSMARAMFSMPALGRTAARALLRRPRDPRRR